MDRLDSRRLTGPNLLLDRPGAILEVVSLPGGGRGGGRGVGGAGAADARRGRLAGRGDRGAAVRRRRQPGDLGPHRRPLHRDGDQRLGLGRGRGRVAGRQAPDFQAAAARLRDEIAREANPALLALRDAAAARGVSFLAGRPLRLGGPRQGVARLARPRPPRSRGDRLEPGLRHPRAAGHRDQRQDHHRPAAGGDGGRLRADGRDDLDRPDRGRRRGDRARRLLRARAARARCCATGGWRWRSWRRPAAGCCGGGSPSTARPPPWSPTSPPTISASSGSSTCRRWPRPSWWSPAPWGRRGGSCSTPTIPSWSRRRIGVLSAPILWFSLDAGQPARAAGPGGGRRGGFLEDGALVLARGRRRAADRGHAGRGRCRSPSAAPPGTTSPTPSRRSPWRRRSASRSRRWPRGCGGSATVPRTTPGGPTSSSATASASSSTTPTTPTASPPCSTSRSTLPAERRLLLLGQAGDRDDEAIRDLARAALPFQAGPHRDQGAARDAPRPPAGRGPRHPGGRAAAATACRPNGSSTPARSSKGRGGAGGGADGGSGGAAGAHPAGGGAGGDPRVGGGGLNRLSRRIAGWGSLPSRGLTLGPVSRGEREGPLE